MNNKKILIPIFLLLIGILAYFFMESPQTVSWKESYTISSKAPFGIHIIYNLVENQFKDYEFQKITRDLDKALPIESDEGPINYVFIGGGIYLDTLELTHLTSFVQAGNNVFIASKSIPQDLMFYLYNEECEYGTYWSDYEKAMNNHQIFNFHNKNLFEEDGYKFEAIKYHKPINYRWNYISTTYFCEEFSSMKPLGYFGVADSLGVSSKTNFVKIDYGKGTFFLHTTPLNFANYHLITPQGLAYAERVFSYLPEGPVYWDVKNNIDERASRRRNNPWGGDHELDSEGPLDYILSQKSLTWAWYSLISLAILYILFRAKRKQSIVPVLEENQNTSLQYANMVAQLFFKQQDHQYIAKEKLKYFTSFVRDRYQINLKTFNKEEAEQLAYVAKIDPDFILKLFEKCTFIKSTNYIYDNNLISFHQFLEKFYVRYK